MKIPRFTFRLSRLAAAVWSLSPIAAAAAPAVIAIAAYVAQVYGYAALAVAIVVAGALHQRRQARAQAARARAKTREGLGDRSITILSADPPWRVVYGEASGVGGDIMDIVTTDKTAENSDGNDYTLPDAYKHLVISMASHEVHAIDDVYIDGIAVGELDEDGWATEGEFVNEGKVRRDVTFTGSVTVDEPVGEVLSSYDPSTDEREDVPVTLSNGNRTITGPGGLEVKVIYWGLKTTASVRVQKHLGTSGQTVDDLLHELVPSRYTTAHRLRGRAYCVVTLDLENQRFQGAPPQITFKVRGKKLYDPRTGLTEYSWNPALCIRDWLLAPWGYEVSEDHIDDDYTIAAANACDEEIDFVVDGDVVSAERFTCNGAFTTAQPKESVIEDLCESMAGVCVNAAQWMIIPGTWTPPVNLPDGAGLLDKHLFGQIEVVQAGSSSGEVFNGVRGQYIPRNKSQPVDFAPYQNAAFVEADGAELWRNVELPFTFSKVRAANLARILVERERSAMVIRYPAQLIALELTIGDRIEVTSAEYGFNAKVFRVIDWQFGITSPVLLTLQEDDPSIYDEADATESDPTPNTDLPNPWIVSAVEGLDMESGTDHLIKNADGSITTRVHVTWPQLTDAYMLDGSGTIRLRWSRNEEKPQEIRVKGDATSAYLTGVKDKDRIILEVWAVNALGAIGPSELHAHTVVGKTEAPDNVTGLAAVVEYGGVLISWTGGTDVDYKFTEIRVGGAGWSTATRIFKGAATSYAWIWPAYGAYTVRAKHFDTTGNESTTAATTTVTVTEDNLLLDDGGIKLSVGGGNMLLNTSYERDSNADGVADSWQTFAAGSTGTITRSIQSSGAFDGMRFQRVHCTALGNASSDLAGVAQSFEFPAGAIDKFIAGVRVKGSTNCKAFIRLRQYDDTATSIAVETVSQALTSSWAVVKLPEAFTVLPDAVMVIASIMIGEQTGTPDAAQIDIDCYSLVIGGTLPGWAPNPADKLPKNWYQDSAPNVNLALDGDTWTDTNNRNVVYELVDGAWELVPEHIVDTDQIVPGAATKCFEGRRTSNLVASGSNEEKWYISFVVTSDVDATIELEASFNGDVEFAGEAQSGIALAVDPDTSDSVDVSEDAETFGGSVVVSGGPTGSYRKTFELEGGTPYRCGLFVYSGPPPVSASASLFDGILTANIMMR